MCVTNKNFLFLFAAAGIPCPRFPLPLFSSLFSFSVWLNPPNHTSFWWCNLSSIQYTTIHSSYSNDRRSSITKSNIPLQLLVPFEGTVMFKSYCTVIIFGNVYYFEHNTIESASFCFRLQLWIKVILLLNLNENFWAWLYLFHFIFLPKRHCTISSIVLANVKRDRKYKNFTFSLLFGSKCCKYILWARFLTRFEYLWIPWGTAKLILLNRSK